MGLFSILAYYSGKYMASYVLGGMHDISPQRLGSKSKV